MTPAVVFCSFRLSAILTVIHRLHPHRDRALSALCRDRHPVGPLLADLPLHREAEGSRPAARRELKAMGFADAHLDEFGYVYATIPATTDKKVPVICFCSHMDTSPDCTGKDVKPQIVQELSRRRHRASGRSHPVIRAAEHPALAARSATTSSPPTAPPCWAPTTRPASPRSWMPRNSWSTIPRSSTAPSRSCSRRTKRSAAASTRPT